MVIVRNVFKTSGYISDALTHWTGHKAKNPSEAFNTLKKIAESRQLKFNEEDDYPVIFKHPSGYKMQQRMICFTDTPIEQAMAHRKKYGNFGISFIKDIMIFEGVHPVFYYQKHLKEDIMKLCENERSENVVLSLLQPYRQENDNKLFFSYYEREWRMIRVIPSELYNPLKDVFHYQEPGKKFSIEKSIINKKKVFFLKYTDDSIANIIVPAKFKRRGENLIKENKLNCPLIVLHN